MPFPKNFMWGAASAAAQIEGGWNEDGRTPSIWDLADGYIKNGQTCHTACDHYHHYKEDVAMMKKLGIKNYRFSISWNRIISEKGTVNEKGISFYRSLIGELKNAGIEPVITLFHWDLPDWAHKEGGWASEKIVGYYKTYVEAVLKEFGTDVRYWITFNEPQIFINMGYYDGTSAPFITMGDAWVVTVRNFLLAHGEAVKIIRKYCCDAQIGIAMATGTYIPDDETPEGLALAVERTFQTESGERGNSIFLDPMCLGKVTPMMKEVLSEEDLEIITQPIDFIGVNVYQGCNEQYPDSKNYPTPDTPRTMMNWVIDERCLYWTIRLYHERYQLPIMVTENGMANPDVVDIDGHVHDEARINFIDDFLSAVKRAIEEGIPVLGYLYWAIMDNFEWREGYGPRFGIVHVDYDTQVRTIKDSAIHYAEIIRENGQQIR